jgi:uncharacterized protein YndB with AHSA1/START domain
VTERSTSHDTFVIERTYPASPARVFAAWASPKAKQAWFGGGEGWKSYEMDFKVGGRERGLGGPPGGDVYTYDATYHEIVPGERIVYAYVMDRNETRISVSVATIEIAADGAGTRLTMTEQGVFLDGQDKSEFREGGTKELLDALGKALAADA